jgi:addiction module RelE/StbE family toxin
MKIRWTPEAEEERFAIWAYIAENNPEAAARMDALFSAAAANLAVQPQLGRAGKISGTRELIPHENYQLVYEVTDQTVWILALVHVARLWPPLKCA